MSFLGPILGAVAGPLLGKLLHLNKGGVVHVKGAHKKRGAIAVIHDGEMVVPKKSVARTKRAMKDHGVHIPKPRVVRSAPATARAPRTSKPRVPHAHHAMHPTHHAMHAVVKAIAEHIAKPRRRKTKA
jgi:hypothetical protein